MRLISKVMFVDELTIPEAKKLHKQEMGKFFIIVNIIKAFMSFLLSRSQKYWPHQDKHFETVLV